jgi:hypothetical protein
MAGISTYKMAKFCNNSVTNFEVLYFCSNLYNLACHIRTCSSKQKEKEKTLGFLVNVQLLSLTTNNVKDKKYRVFVQNLIFTCTSRVSGMSTEH